MEGGGWERVRAVVECRRVGLGHHVAEHVVFTLLDSLYLQVSFYLSFSVNIFKQEKYKMYSFRFTFGERILLERYMYSVYNYNIIDNQKCIVRNYYFEVIFICYYLGVDV